MRKLIEILFALVIFLFGIGSALAFAQAVPQVLPSGDPLVKSGTIERVDQGSSALTVRVQPGPDEDAGAQTTYYLDPGAQIVKDDDPSELKDLSAGERVTVNYVIMPDGQAIAYFVLVQGQGE